jgi:hypothetical protein
LLTEKVCKNILDVAVVRELVGVVPLTLIYHSDGVSDELIHAVMALAGANFCYCG